MNEETIEQRLDEALGSFDEPTRRDIKHQVLPVIQQLTKEALLDQLKTVTIEEGDIVLYSAMKGYALPPSEFDHMVRMLQDELDLDDAFFLEGVDLESVDRKELEDALARTEA